MSEPDDIADLRARLAAARDALAALHAAASHDAAHAQHVTTARAETADLTAALRAQGVAVGAEEQPDVASQPTITTAGGSYAESDRHQQGAFISGTAQGTVIGAQTGGTVITNVYPHAATTALLSPKERRVRAQMLAKVRATWMPLLDESLQDVVRLDLGLTSAAVLVDDPRKRLRQPNRPERLLPRGTPIHAVFDELAGELLILGAPGAGKTTMLLELTRELLDRAQHDAAHAIPVVFNLSTWAEQHPSINTWLVDELSKRYDVPRTLGQAWVDEGAILPLLDGLDEVALDQRPVCVGAINAYHGAHGPLQLVVCSRSADYELLTVRLQLQGAVVIQPLGMDQIDAALAQAGDRLDGVRVAIRDDIVLQELATTPLLLSVMILAYRDHDSRSLAAFDTLDAQRTHLFAAYVDAMFVRRGEDARYPRTRTLHYLAWLARGMVKHSHTVFYIEQLQPTWLTTSQQHRGYTVSLELAFGLVFGLVFGVAEGLNIGRIRGVVVGLGGGLIFGLVFGLIGARVPITAVEQLRWSWTDTLFIAQRSLRRLWVFGLIVGLFGVWFGGPAFGLFSGLTSLPIMGLIIGLIGGVTSTTIPLKAAANEGIRRSVRNALLIWLVVGVVVGLVFGLGVRPLFGLHIGLYLGLMGALIYGGLACIQHLVLRILIWRNGDAPWNYAAFLDSAADRILLRKVGGGYIFIHRMLMEYFAALEGDVDGRNSSEEAETD